MTANKTLVLYALDLDIRIEMVTINNINIICMGYIDIGCAHAFVYYMHRNTNKCMLNPTQMPVKN